MGTKWYDSEVFFSSVEDDKFSTNLFQPFPLRTAVHYKYLLMRYYAGAEAALARLGKRILGSLIATSGFLCLWEVRMNGQGAGVRNNGDTYEDEWCDIVPHIERAPPAAVKTTSDGSRYDAHYKDGKRHGQGVRCEPTDNTTRVGSSW